MPNLKVSDAMWNTAEAVVATAKKAGIQLKVSDVYKKENMNSMALVANFLIQLANSSSQSNDKIEIIKD